MLDKTVIFHPGGVCLFLSCPNPGAAEPRVHAVHDEDDLLSPLPRHGLSQTLCQLLQQRHEGLSGQPG